MLPVIIFLASLTAALYDLGVAANIFVGQTDAPLLIRPYIARMTRPELFAVMVGGLSTVAGSVLVGYSLLEARLEYLIAAAFMAAPGALLMAKLLVPAGTLEASGARGGAPLDGQDDELGGALPPQRRAGAAG